MCSLFETPGRTYLDHLGLSDHPLSWEIVQDLDDAILSAAEQVIAERSTRDPVMRAMLSPRYALWERVDIPIEHARLGMWIEGWVPHGNGYTRTEINGQISTITDRWITVVRHDSGLDRPVQGTVEREAWSYVRAVLPVPLDAATLTEDRPGY
ncbi:hypothetical protein [Nocardioides pakistanensis]